jgi:hypothetical protein
MAFLPGPREEHRYQTCQDEYCERFPCRVYREGYAAVTAPGPQQATRPGALTATRRATATARPMQRSEVRP